MFKDAEENVLNVVWDWVATMADRVGIDRAWESAVAIVQQLGIDSAWVWFAAQTQAVTGKAADLAVTLRTWEYQSEVDANLRAVESILVA